MFCSHISFSFLLLFSYFYKLKHQFYMVVEVTWGEDPVLMDFVSDEGGATQSPPGDSGWMTLPCFSGQACAIHAVCAGLWRVI